MEAIGLKVELIVVDRAAQLDVTRDPANWEMKISYSTPIRRSAMLDTIRLDCIRTAGAKGLRERIVVLRHALMNGVDHRLRELRRGSPPQPLRPEDPE